MEANICDTNHLDADVLLPPRKRLLAGFKKQSSEGDTSHHPTVIASSSSSASPSSPSPSPSPPPPPSPAPSSPSSADFQNRLNSMLTCHFSNNQNLSPEQIVEASKSAAVAAVKAAEAARAVAQDKAIVAAKAVTAAKSALALVASFPEDGSSKEKCLKKNKLKKHVQVQLLYKKHHPIENSRDDEELARKLHRVMNSSPRITKNPSSSDLKGHKSKRPKTSQISERAKASDGTIVLEGNPTSMCNDHTVAAGLDSNGSIRDEYMSLGDENAPKYESSAQLELNHGEAESSHSKEKAWGDAGSPVKKRGRLKLKKLPLSICNSRDQAQPKEDAIPRSSPLKDKNMGNPTSRSKPLFPMEPSASSVIPIRATPTWKFQDFKAPACIEQNKVMQS